VAAPADPGLDPAGVLPPPEAPLAPGTWIDRTPCPPQQSLSSRGVQLAHAAGRLFSIDAGDGNGGPSHLWEWDEDARHFWDRTSCQPSDTWPVVQGSAVLGYDASKDALVLAGETYYPSALTMTWTRPLAGDGQWTSWPATYLVNPAGYDPKQATIFHDPERRSLMLLPALLELPDGASDWVSLDTTLLNRPNGVGAVAYDPGRRTFLNAVVPQNPGQPMTTWEFSLDSGSWTDRTPAAGPPSAPSSAFAWWNPSSQRTELLTLDGDFASPGSPSVWAWDPVQGSWQSVPPASDTTVPAPPVTIQAASFDETRARLVIWLDHQAGIASQELWAWNTAPRTWTRLSPDRWPVLGPWLSDRIAAYDSVRRRTVMLGIDGAGDGLVRVIEWDGESTAFVDRRVLGVCPWPGPLQNLAAAYDRDRQRLVMFAVRPGPSQSPRPQGELWEWDGATGSWTDLTPARQPSIWPGVDNWAMAYDATRKRIVLWGTGATSANLYEWDAATGTWSRPIVPFYVQLLGVANVAVYDERRALTVLAAYGPGAPTIAEWDGNTLNYAINQRPLDQGWLAGAYDARAARVMLVTLGTTTPQLLSWDGQVLADVTPPALAAGPFDLSVPIYPSGGEGGLVYDLRRGNIMLFAPPRRSSPSTLDWSLHVWEGAGTAQ
jgi:hypothetical protein